MNQPLMLAGIVAASWLPWFDKEEEPPPPVVPEPEVVEVVEEPLTMEALLLFYLKTTLSSNTGRDWIGYDLCYELCWLHNTAFTQWMIPATIWEYKVQIGGCYSRVWRWNCMHLVSSPFDVQHEELTTEIIENDIARPVMEAIQLESHMA